MRIRLLWTLSVLVVVFPAFGGVVAPSLANAFFFGLLAGDISNTGTSVVTGNVGATISITGFPPGTAVSGTVFTSPNGPSTTVGQAYTDFVTAFDVANSNISTPVTQLPVSGLSGGHTFFGNNVYEFLGSDVSSVAGATLTFDANGDSSQKFISFWKTDPTLNDGKGGWVFVKQQDFGGPAASPAASPAQ